MQADQRERLLVAKLTGLVRSSGLPEGHALEPEVRGALTVAIDGPTAYGLIEKGDPGAVASAVLWARRNNCLALTLFVDEDAPAAARFCGYFASAGTGLDAASTDSDGSGSDGSDSDGSDSDGPGLSLTVRQIRGASSVVVEADPVPLPVAAPDDAGALIDVLRSHGLEVVVEHGVVRGEVLGLEVARLVRWPASNGGDDELHLEAGVGRFDRDAVAAVSADMPPEAALAQTLEVVRKYRYPDAPFHPLQFLSQERWLRVSIMAEPELVGATRLNAVAMTSEAHGMRDSQPAAAYGEGAEGRPVIVVCSTGINMAAVPLAADLRASLDPTADLVIVVPERDRHSATVELAGMLDGRVEVLGVAVGWG